MRSVECPICSNLAFEVFPVAPGSESIVWACSSCQSEFLSPQPGRVELDREYEGYFDRRATNKFSDKSEYYSYLLKQLPFSCDGRSVVDLGAGEGGLARVLVNAQRVPRVEIVDPLLEGVESFDCRVLAHRQSIEAWLLGLSGRKYDVVFMLDVLEHLRDPKLIFRLLSERALARGGYLVVTTPSTSALSRLFLGRHWPHYKLEHLFYFSPVGLRELCKGVGIMPLVLHPWCKRLPLGYVIQVGSLFGPPLLRRVVGQAGKLFPRVLRGRSLTLPSGEMLLVARAPI